MVPVYNKVRLKTNPYDEAKALGAFYTDVQIAEFLVWWGIQDKNAKVIDPCFGGGVFLRAACKRIKELGGLPEKQVYGVEIDEEIFSNIVFKLRDEFNVPKKNFIKGDFFEVGFRFEKGIDTLVGNPPFIRYQSFSGNVRKKALREALKRGVRLSRLTSSWAPFLINSAGILKNGGRLAMVVPFEIVYALYAKPVLEFLSKSFEKITLLTFKEKLFPGLSENTCLLLAENKGMRTEEIKMYDLVSAGYLNNIMRNGCLPKKINKNIKVENINNNKERFAEYFIPKKTRELYGKLKNSDKTENLNSVANVGIGYVTGGNDFFHLGQDDINKWGIPKKSLKRAVRRAKAFKGLKFTEEDWSEALLNGYGAYLLLVKKIGSIPDSVKSYIAYGEKNGVNKSYKCRTRDPWFSVPHVYCPEGFLTYMTGLTPRIVTNEARVVAPNTLHVIRVLPEVRFDIFNLVTLSQTSLTLLSAELEGHVLGGGMLKLEPSEAGNLLFVSRNIKADILEGIGEEIDNLIRNDEPAKALFLADEIILKKGMGLTRDDCKLLRNGLQTLRNRRYHTAG